jgi:hypothetical protein
MGLAVKQSIHATFGRHETFTPRYSWLKRGYDALAGGGGRYIFATYDAHHDLGVGKNQARSIRFWLQAFRIVEERKIEGRREPTGSPTVFGEALLNDDFGLDPYLEDMGSWWLLHWMALSPGGYLPVWWAAFHTFPAQVFNVDQLVEHVQAQIDATSSWNQPKPPHTTTVRKDVLALLRAYAGTSGSRRKDTDDDGLDNPLVPLTLLRQTDELGTFRFGVGPKPGLPTAVAAFACLDFLARNGATSRQTLVATLATEQGGPGRAFKLTERDLTDLLARAAELHPDLIAMTISGGSDTLSVVSDEPLDLVGAWLLHRHYAALGAACLEPPRSPYFPRSHHNLPAQGA